jgi:hypothetical protein
LILEKRRKEAKYTAGIVIDLPPEGIRFKLLINEVILSAC